MRFIRRCWLELLVFGAIFTILMVDLATDYTFINKAADSIGYLYSAKYLYPAYHTSAPLYLLISHLFLKIPFGTDAWRMGLVSVLPTMGACLFVYLSIRKHLPKSRYYPLLGTFLYGTSALVVSQSVIIQTYPLICMLAVGAYYFALCKKWKTVSIMLGLGLAVHLLAFFVAGIFFLGYREYRKKRVNLLITSGFVLFYLYIPLTNRPPYMWLPDPSSSNTLVAIFLNIASTIDMLVFTIAIQDLPKRILDTSGVIGVSVGIIALIPIVYYFIKTGAKTVLFWLATFPIIFFIGELDMNTYDYTMLSIPFLAIAACLGLDAWVRHMAETGAWFMTGVLLNILTFISVVGFGVYNANYFDIGRTLDPQMSASNLYYIEFAKVPDYAIFMPNYGWEWESIYKYNADYGRHLIPVTMDCLNSANYRASLLKQGIRLEVSSNINQSIAAKEMGKSIIRLNDVWTTKMIDSRTFGSVVVPANHDVTLVEFDEESLLGVAREHSIRWQPSNPYDIITTSICVTEWKNVLNTNWNMRFFALLTCIGILLSKLTDVLMGKKKFVNPLKDL